MEDLQAAADDPGAADLGPTYMTAPDRITAPVSMAVSAPVPG
jgi:hypothetical protein